jgi:hypothetical protein
LSFHAHVVNRRVTLAAGKTELANLENPEGDIQVPIERKDLLRVDSRGGIYIELAVSDMLQRGRGTAKDEVWTIENLGLQVTGQMTQQQ